MMLMPESALAACLEARAKMRRRPAAPGVLGGLGGTCIFSGWLLICTCWVYMGIIIHAHGATDRVDVELCWLRVKSWQFGSTDWARFGNHGFRDGPADDGAGGLQGQPEPIETLTQSSEHSSLSPGSQAR